MTDSPTFVARFADNEVIRMSTHTPTATLDVGRGVRLAIAAYETRVRGRRAPFSGGTQIEIPLIVEAHFEAADGAVLQTYGAEDLAAIEKSHAVRPTAKDPT
jgi:hypothetical protein